MKKQVIFIYDPFTDRLVQVCDVRSLTPEQLDSFTKIAKSNTKEKIATLQKKYAELEQKYEIDIKELQDQITDLQVAVAHLLGFTEFEEPYLKACIRWRDNDDLEGESHVEEE